MYQSESVTRFLAPQILTEEDKVKEKEKNIKECIANIQTIYSWQTHTFWISIFMGNLLFLIVSWFQKDFFNFSSFFTGFIGLISLYITLVSLSSRKYMKKLFLELSDHPFEIRIESTGFFSNRLKVIIEENQLVGGCYVVKEKSKHITAYIDISSQTTSLVEAIQNLVIKAESTFIQK